jgi:hypothetical protein
MKLTIGAVTKGVNWYAIVMDFNLYFAVRTKEALLGSEKRYIERAEAIWHFNGSGTVDAAGFWTRIVGVTGNKGGEWFTEQTSGAVVPITVGPIANYQIATQTWATVNQP